MGLLIPTIAACLTNAALLAAFAEASLDIIIIIIIIIIIPKAITSVLTIRIKSTLSVYRRLPTSFRRGVHQHLLFPYDTAKVCVVFADHLRLRLSLFGPDDFIRGDERGVDFRLGRIPCPARIGTLVAEDAEARERLVG